MNYFDTSALIKRFIAERGSKAVTALFGEEPMAATSVVSYAEVHAALARKARERVLPSSSHRRVMREFDADWRAWLRIAVNEQVLARVPRLVRRHPLRGFDAIHLAAAVHLQAELAQPVTFVAADDRLLTAAAGERLAVVDVSS